MAQDSKGEIIMEYIIENTTEEEREILDTEGFE